MVEGTDNRARALAITETIAPRFREDFAREVLAAVVVGMDVPTDVLLLTNPDLDFLEAAETFYRLRPLTITAEAIGAQETSTLVLLTAENAAKVIADPWGERFDRDSVGWFWICVERLLDVRGDDALRLVVNSMFESARNRGSERRHSPK